MKVIHIITGLENGGAEGVLYRLVTQDTTNHHIVISLTDMGKYGNLLSSSKIKVYCINMKKRGMLLCLYSLYRIIKEIQPNVVQTWMYHADLIGGIVARIAGVKKIYWNIRHSTIDSGHTRKSTVLIAKLNAYLSYIIPNKIICCAYSALEVHSNLGYKSNIMKVIPNGYDFSQFNIDQDYRNKFRQEIGVDSNVFLIGMVARFNPQKDHKNLLEAFEAFSKDKVKGNIKLILVGDGINQENKVLVNLINKLDLVEDVILLGPRNDINRVMNGLDIHVLSSYAGEGFPNVVAEAMACGTPCIVTDVGDSKLIVDKCGWIIPPSSSQALFNAMKCALLEFDDCKAWEIKKNKNSEFVKSKFSIDEIVSFYNSEWVE